MSELAPVNPHERIVSPTMVAVSELAPVDPHERIVSLDILRGFALWGVLMGNLLWLYTGRIIAAPAESTVDTIARVVFGFFVENKAFTILTFLFGFGFSTQLLRAQNRGESGIGLFVRRLVVLLVIGWCHIAVFWFGDITWTYALTGFGLLLFRHASNGVRLVCGVMLAVVPLTLWTWLDGWRIQLLFMEPNDWARYARGYYEATQTASWVDMIRENAQFALVFSAANFVWYVPSNLGRFLIGYVAGAQRWFERDGADHLPLFRRMMIGGLVVGVPCATVGVLAQSGVIDRLGYELRPVADSLVFTIQLLGLSAAYIGIVVLLVQRARWRRVLSIVAPAGRMPLTTYVMQSLIATTLFWGRGLGWATPGIAACLGLCVVIFAGQVGFAHLWLRYFRFGPLEWMWRSLAYLRRQPMRV